MRRYIHQVGLRLDIGTVPYENIIAYPISYNKVVESGSIYTTVQISGYVIEDTLNGTGITELFATGLQTDFGTFRFLMYYDQQYHDTKFVFREPWSIDNVVMESGGYNFSFDFVKTQSFQDVLEQDTYLTRTSSYSFSGVPDTGIIPGMSGVWESMYITESDDVELFGRIIEQIDYDFEEVTSSGTSSVTRYYEPDYGYLISNVNKNFVTIKNTDYYLPNTGVLYETGIFDRNWSAGPTDVDWSGNVTKESTYLNIDTSTADECWASFIYGPIDIAGFGNLTIDWSHYSDIPLGGMAFLAIDPSGNTAYEDHYLYFDISAGTNSPATETLNVSAESGYYYIYCGLYTTGKPSNIYLNVTKVELT